MKRYGWASLAAGLLGIVMVPVVRAQDEFVSNEVILASASEACSGPNCGQSHCQTHGCCARRACCGPNWEVSLGVLSMTREDPDDGFFGGIFGPGIGDVNAAGTSSSSSSLFDFDEETGFELVLSGRLSDRWDIDIRAMEVEGWEAVRTFGTQADAVALDNGSSLVLAYESNLRGLEVMFMTPPGGVVRVGFGLRWVQFTDDLSARFSFSNSGPTPPTPTTLGASSLVLRSNTRNDLYGVQVGADAVLWSAGRFNIQGVSKIGVYSNNANASLSGQIVGLGSSSASTIEGDEVAFVGEVGIFGVYRLSRSWAARLGYQAIYLDGLALAIEQDGSNGVSNAGTNGSTRSVNTDGNLWVSGGIFAVEYSW